MPLVHLQGDTVFGFVLFFAWTSPTAKRENSFFLKHHELWLSAVSTCVLWSVGTQSFTLTDDINPISWPPPEIRMFQLADHKGDLNVVRKLETTL